MPVKPLTEKQCFDSFRAYEMFVDKEVKAGNVTERDARSYLLDARKNYSNQSHNKQLCRMKIT